MKPWKIPLTSLSDCNPFENVIWSGITRPITKAEVKKAICEKNFMNIPWEMADVECAYEVVVSNKRHMTRKQHAARIGFFVTYGWTDPIEIDVGVPNLACYVDWIVEDGNHRLAAAFYMGNEYIEANVSGDLSYARKMLKPLVKHRNPMRE